MAFNIFATATSDIPLANLDANFTLIGAAAAASTLYPTATTSITYGTAGTTHNFSGSGLAVTGTLTSTLDATIYGLTVGRGGGAVSTNTAVGASAGYSNTTGTYNVFLGSLAGYGNLSANANTAVGYQAFYTNSTGANNSIFGAAALYFNTTGSNNTAIGEEALKANTTASNNTAVGYQAGYSVTTSTENVFFGYQSGKSSTGQLNTIIGSLSGFTNISGTENCYVGAGAGYLATGSQNTFVGRGASIAAGSSMTTGSKNTIIGAYTGNQGSLDIRTASNYIVLSDGDGNPRQIIDSSGNLGLGVTAPLNRLDARAASAVIANYQTIQASSTDSAAIDLGGGIGLGGYYNGTAAYATFGNIVGRKENSTSGNYAGYLAFGTNAQATGVVERARINSIGDLLVNQTAAGLQNSNSFGCGPSDVGFVANHVSGTAGGTTFGNFGLAGAGIGSITQNGTTGVLYNLTSDYRLKNDQQPLTGAKDFIMALKPKKWQWWDGSGEGVGFVAHEFMEVAKYSGHGEKDAVDAEGKPIMQSIQPSSSEVMANLISFIQEQQAIITALTTRITALEAK